MFRLIKSYIYGIIALIATFFFVVYLLGGNPYNDYLLLKKGTTIKGFVTNITEDVEERDAGGADYYYNISYYFNLPDCKKVESFQATHSLFSQKIPDLKYPYPIEVVYLNNDPNINKLKYTLPYNKSDFFLKKILAGIIGLVMFGSIGFIFIWKATKKYIASKNNLAQS